MTNYIEKKMAEIGNEKIATFGQKEEKVLPFKRNGKSIGTGTERGNIYYKTEKWQFMTEVVANKIG